MQTYSHLLVTAALVKPAQALVKRYPDRLPSVHVNAFLLGGVLPDLLLILLSIWAIGDDWRHIG